MHVVLHAEEFAKIAAEGFRPPRMNRLSEDVWDLISQCWAQDPIVRPAMATVSSSRALQYICMPSRMRLRNTVTGSWYIRLLP
jgi:hypothetical protein